MPLSDAPSRSEPVGSSQKVVVETILSPDLERERRALFAARDKAAQILQDRGIAVPNIRMIDNAISSFNRRDVFYVDFAERVANKVEEEIQREADKDVLSRYDLGYGYLGNGLTVWNRLEEEHGDYKTIAHIDPDRSVKFYDNTLPEVIKEQIRRTAATTDMTISAAQDTPVFSAPAQEPEQTHDTQETEGKTIPEVDPFPSQHRREKIAQASPWWLDYLDAKAANPDMMLLYQVGDFYEMFGADAKDAAELLDLQLANRNIDGVGRMVFCGLPAHNLDYYTEKLRAKFDIAVSRKGEGKDRELFTILSIDHEAEKDIDAHESEFGADGNRAFPDKEREQDGESNRNDEVETDEADNDSSSETGTTEIFAEPDFTPNVDQYFMLKAQHPDKLIGVQVGDYMLFYGKDAEAAAPALRSNLLTREIAGLGETYVTGTNQSWQLTMKKLLEHGHSVLLVKPDQQQGLDAPYEIIAERDAAGYIPIGKELTIDGRRMKIDSVDYTNGKVSLQDMELQGWYPVFRPEPVDYVRQLVEEAEEKELDDLARQEETENLIQSLGEGVRQEENEQIEIGQAVSDEPEQIEIDGGQIAETPNFTEETVAVHHGGAFDVEVRVMKFGPDRHNFQITDDNLGAGGQKTKYQNNVAAIRTLKQIEAESRLATQEEQEILSRYVGWGGIAQAFDTNNEKWAKEYTELRELLTDAEYASARSTTINAHYTSPTVIKAIYQAVRNMDFQPGNVLEPSCGIGNFFGLLPEELSGSKLYGVELDDLTGRIAKQLYQKANITIDGFERTSYPDDFFDLAVGNVPFGEYHVHDRRYDRYNLLIHDYFIEKTLDKVRPGGIVAFVTTKGTMDKGNSKVREMFAQKADLLGAIRLPNNAFRANAGTEVTADILFFQKRDHAPEKMPSWVEVGQTADGVPLNRYFLEHPEMVLGKMSFWQNMYGNEAETACLPIDGAVLSEQLAEAISHIAPPDRELLMAAAQEQEEGNKVVTIPADPSVRNYSYALVDGKLYFRENSFMKRMDLGTVPTERIKGMIAIRDSARKLIDLQLNGADDAAIKAEQEKLSQLYDAFSKQYGLLNSSGNRQAFEQDSSYPLLCSLEVIDEDGRLERKADMFTKRTIQRHQPVTSVDTAAEALAVSISEKACVDLGYMAQLMGGSDKITQIVEDLQGVIFKDPATGPFDLESGGTNWFLGWQTADEYLSGNVRQKLAQARDAAEEYPEFSVNADMLEKVQPKDLTAPENRFVVD